MTVREYITKELEKGNSIDDIAAGFTKEINAAKSEIDKKKEAEKADTIKKAKVAASRRIAAKSILDYLVANEMLDKYFSDEINYVEEALDDAIKDLKTLEKVKDAFGDLLDSKEKNPFKSSFGLF
jgi:gamma-glutamyl phosphate reductase